MTIGERVGGATEIKASMGRLCVHLYTFISSFVVKSLRYDLVEDEEGDAKDKDERQHGLAGLAVAVERREELMIGLAHIVVRPARRLVDLFDLVLLLQKLACEEAQEVRQFQHLAFHHPVLRDEEGQDLIRRGVGG